MIRIHRHPQAPKSLAKKKSYSGEDVRNQLQEDFFGKCYLCERYVGSDFQVEHLKPKSGYPDLEFEWKNLFPACTCNQRRLKWSGRSELDAQGNPTCFPIGGMLDSGQDDIESRLDQWLEIGAKSTTARFLPLDPDDLAAANTAEELEAIHRGETGHAIRLRDEIRQYAAYIAQRIVAYKEATSDKSREIRLEIRGLTLPYAEFAGLVRGYLKRQLNRETLDELGISV